MSGRRHSILALVALTLAAVLTGCGGDKATQKEMLLDTLQRTRLEARAFTYRERPTASAGLPTYDVVGIVEDDYRFKARLSINGAAVKEEVAVDDALAVRFLDAEKVGFFVDRDKLNAALGKARSTDGSLPELRALQANRWVLDPTGAPSLAFDPQSKRKLGDDPLIDALSVLDHAIRVVSGAVLVAKYSKDSIDPLYKPKEDPFEKPDPGAPITRYDVPLQDFPRAGDPTRQGRSVTPGDANFRKMAVFVQGGRVVKISEDVDVLNRLDELKRSFSVDQDLDVATAVAAINKLKKERAEDPFRPRVMEVTFTFGGEARGVALPEPSERVEGSLAFLKARGRVRPGATTTTTTSPAAADPSLEATTTTAAPPA